VVCFAVQTVLAESVDLGVVEAHRKVECGFAITNDTSTAWFVQGERSACACMAVEVRQGELGAGEALPVRVYTVWHEENLRRGVDRV